MIAQLTGRLVHTEAGRGVVDVRGVGYEVFATSRAFAAWAEIDEVVVHVSTQVREDAIALYGFERPLERTAFTVLLGVSGVGPRMALAALDTLTVEELTRAVETDDAVALGRIPGVGKKTAQRLALELKGKLPVSFEVAARSGKAPSRPADPLPLALAPAGVRQIRDRSCSRGSRATGHRR